MTPQERIELEKQAQEAIKRNSRGLEYVRRSWTWNQIYKGENPWAGVTSSSGRPWGYPWLPNVYEPSWWCKVFHKHLWWTTDLHHSFNVECRPFYHTLCRRCGRCWYCVKDLEWFQRNNTLGNK